MDSITQAALGAAVAEAGMGGRRLGNKAILWGVALGTLPDLDIIAYPWLDEIQRLEWHRGWSHSLFILLLASPLLGVLVSKIHHGRVGIRRATATIFAVLATHVLIDVFTVYGTMVFAPFSDHRAAWNNLFIIDPLFSLPLILGISIATFSNRNSHWRSRANIIGLALASLYAVWSLGAKSLAESRIHDTLAEAGITHRRLAVSPTPFNTLLWRGLAERDKDFVITYHSLLNPAATPTFEVLPKNHEALAEIADSRAVTRLAWFSNGFHSATKTADGWIISDWRFGEWQPADPSASTDPVSMFTWKLTIAGDSVTATSLRPAVNLKAQIDALGRKITGN